MVYFLASLHRSGSTLLASLLNQRPDTYASPTSNLCETMGAAIQAWENSPATRAQGGTEEDLFRVLKSILKSRYTAKNTVFDKGRNWPNPNIIQTMKKLQGDVKIVATVRPIADCMASFAKISRPDDIREFCKNSPLSQKLMSSYHHMKAGYEAYPECFLFVEYDDLIKNPQAQLDRISEFIGKDSFQHSFDNVKDSEEEDEVWGIKDLHKVRKKVSKRRYSAKKILGDDLYEYYQGGEFWNDKPEPVRGGDLLDLQLEASLRGDFEKSGQIMDKLLLERPDCNRVKFNAGWHELHRGELLKGHKCLARGRKERVFGNEPRSGQPEWKQGDVGTVLLTLEGGLGDQIHGFRYANDLEKLGNRVALACSPELAPMFAGQFITVQHEASAGVFHDFHVPAMSAPANLGYEYSDLSGEAYIKRTAEPIKGRIGVRWSGNPQFEHEQHRKFPADLMFDAVRSLDCISLQRDEGLELKPGWMPQADVSNWEATRRSISECEKVITSCTSVAHLSAAMGIETWIVVPILPYYLWALPGSTTPYYDSVKLFRQETYGEWSAPFQQIKEELHCSRTLQMVS
jgi:hypothetical protein